MNPGPAPRPPTDRPQLRLTPTVNNLPGNMSAMTMNANAASAGSSSTSSLPSLNRPETFGGGPLSVLKEGSAKVREDGLMKFWSERWLVLRGSQLDFHKSSNSPKINLSIVLRDVAGVTRSESTSMAFEIMRLANPNQGREESNLKKIICRVDTDDEVYSWMDAINDLCPKLGGVSNPTHFTHKVHVGFDSRTGAFTGLPPEWEKLLTNSAISKEDYQKNPTAVIEVLNFYTEKLMGRENGGPTLPNVSRSSSGDSFSRPSNFIGSGSGATVTPPRPKPPTSVARQDSFDTFRSQNQSPVESRNVSSASQGPAQSAQPERTITEARADKERQRKVEEDIRRERMAREQRERDRYREQERARREREEQQAYNDSLPKTRQPIAKQEIGGYGGDATGEHGQSSKWEPSRVAPPPPGQRDRSQPPPGSLRNQQPQSKTARPAGPPNQHNGSRDPQTRPYAQPQGRQQSPSSKAQNQANGVTGASTRIPVKPSQDPNSQRRPDQPAGSGQGGAAPKPLNVTVKQPTGPAAVAEAATKLEAGAPEKDQKREGRMSHMSEAEVMARLRDVVSKEPPLSSYQKQKKIGQGASGSVYAARIKPEAPSPFAREIMKHSGPRPQVAIKQMDLRNQPRKELIVNEIIVMKDSKHPNIVNFIEAFLPEENVELWVVMEFMEGGPLTDIIDNNAAISEDQIATICLEVNLHVPLQVRLFKC